MQQLVMGERTISLDKEGYLVDLQDWNPEVAAALAAKEGLELTEKHWQLIECIRNFYQQFQLSPAMRPLVKYIGQQLGKEKGNSIYLMRLFPESPAKLMAKIAGLPRPDNCL
ncbi:TusE/DsrC/DsvC family sulfur relay protein [Zooshikella ganghwensis]|uniref:Sulfurtransferase n=1 Tax=Zooshikella ganghwensis TaxID=202772 RepID=A0A4P9VLH4_9GAMM|nr:TusE/DsrC/DsvC family sulfur relay protein [Zooshikella ganghwensis]RDH44208.1 TusE/DsrC/DsvC family sulfur relay protein [Zooshikella ganghwensis]